MTASRTGPTAPRSRTLPPPGPVAGYPTIPPAERVVAGRYRLRRLLGRGGMGAAWLACDQAVHRRVAVKQPLPGGLATEAQRRAARARLRREARLAARVDHPATVQVYDLAEEAGDPWIVMEALPGRTLQAALRNDGPLPVGRVTRLGLRLLAALAATHRAGIDHRDVTPGNVQLCGGLRVVLTDFGIAWTAEDGAGIPSGGMVGSPGYVAPEQVHGGRVEPASDLFSLGATLYAAVEGRSPFGRDGTAATLRAVVTDPPAPLLRAGPLGPVIEGLLAKDPARRLGHDQARDALQAITGTTSPPCPVTGAGVAAARGGDGDHVAGVKGDAAPRTCLEFRSSVRSPAVYVVANAWGGWNPETHEMALRRMAQAGAIMPTWLSLACELQRGWDRTETVAGLTQINSEHLTNLGKLSRATSAI